MPRTFYEIFNALERVADLPDDLPRDDLDRMKAAAQEISWRNPASIVTVVDRAALTDAGLPPLDGSGTVATFTDGEEVPCGNGAAGLDALDELRAEIDPNYPD